MRTAYSVAGIMVFILSCSDSRYQELETKKKIQDSLIAQQNFLIDSMRKEAKTNNNTASIQNDQVESAVYYARVSFRYHGTKYRIDDEGVQTYNSEVFKMRDTSDDTKARIIDAIIARFVKGEGRIHLKGDPYDKKIYIKTTYSEASSSKDLGETVSQIVKRVLGNSADTSKNY